MSFISFHFLIFFPLVALIYFGVRPSLKWKVLLIASAYFYMSWVPAFIFLLLYSILASYLSGLWISRADSAFRRKTITAIGIILVLAPLFFFKYFNFFNRELGRLLYGENNAFFQGVSFLLPVGISFFTFQALSYVIDIYRRQRSPEKHFGLYALYVSFFPQLVAGPIERSTRLLPQVIELKTHPEKYSFDVSKAAEGLRLILWGFFQKLVIADNLAVIANEVYAAPTSYHGFMLLIGTYCFAYQIYCDFAGYTNIARGAARILGIELMQNFESPYQAQSIPEFWRRWHISLTTWFRDYVYFPLGGNRVPKAMWLFNVMVVFVLSGIWHGANWTFFFWGAVHGLAYLFVRITESVRGKIFSILRLQMIPKVLRSMFNIFITFHTIILGWVFFRSQNISEAFHILKKIVVDIPQLIATAIRWLLTRHPWNLGDIFELLKIDNPQRLMIWNSGMGIIFAAVVFLELSDYLRRKQNKEFILTNFSPIVRWGVYYILILSIWICAPLGSQQFIYFQF